MKIIRNTLIISSYILLAGLFFSGAYVIGKTTMNGSERQPEPVQAEEAVEAVYESAAKSPVYEVKAENGKIIIYKCIGDEKTVITSDTISERVFPKEDIEELRKGVQFDRLEGAQQMFENFVS